MKYLVYLKLAVGLILVSFPIIVGMLFLKFFFEGFKSESSFLFIKVFVFINDIPLSTLIFFGICGFSGSYLLASVKSTTNVVEIKEVLPSQEPETTPTPPKRDTIERLCKELGIPYSKNQRQEGIASIRFMNKPKEKETE